ncbi:MAG: zinc ribbon domain-containing protein [Candidatus Colwellbacteria bacterium]|nr:zinc ribbon domain-containing protein [Candidatus Colwellbacteria bacterium]
MENVPLVPPIVQCPSCRFPAIQDAYFCYNCGKPLRPKLESISIGKEIIVYLVSFFLAPLGLYFTVKYIRQPGEVSRRIAIISMIITAVAVIIAAYSINTFLQSAYQSINSLNAGLF